MDDISERLNDLRWQSTLSKQVQELTDIVVRRTEEASPEEQAKRDAAYQEAVASRYRGVPVRQVNLSRPGRFVTPNRPTQTDSSSRYQEDNSLTDTILTAVAVSSIFDSDSSSSSSPDPAPSWDSSDSSSGSGFGGGGSSDSW